MNQEQLVKKIKYSLDEGYTQQEVMQVLRQQGVSRTEINQAFNQINSQQQQQQRNQNNPNQNTQQAQNNFGQQDPAEKNQFDTGNSQEPQQNQQEFGQKTQETQDQFGGGNQNQSFNQTTSQSGEGAIPGLDLTDNQYRIVQNLLLRRYKVFDKNDNLKLKAKKKILSITTDIPFSDPESGEVIFRAVSERLVNLSHKYEVNNEKNGEKLAILDKKKTLLNQVWKIRDPEGESVVAEIQNESTMKQILRNYGGIIPYVPNPFALLPHNYSVKNSNGEMLGELQGEFSIKDKYDLKLQDSGQLDREAMIAAIIAIDALEGN